MPLLTYTRKPAGYFHDDPVIDQLYRVADAQESSISHLFVMTVAGWLLAFVALLVALVAL